MTPLERATALLAASRRCASPTCTSCPSTPTAEAIAKVIEEAVMGEREACAAIVRRTAHPYDWRRADLVAKTISDPRARAAYDQSAREMSEREAVGR